MFPETIRKPSTSFANVQLVTALPRDDTDYTMPAAVQSNHPFSRRTATVTNANQDVQLKGWFGCTAAGAVYVIRCQRCYNCTAAKLVEGLWIIAGNMCVQQRVSNETLATRGVGFLWPNTLNNLPEHNQVHDMPTGVCCKGSERKNGNTIARGKTTHFPAGYFSPWGLEH